MRRMTTGIIGILLMLCSCASRDTIVNKDKLLGYDYRLFQGTLSWDLAKAVEDEDTNQIISIVSKNRTLLESKDPKFGQSLLELAVITLKFESVKTLVSLGADPNNQDTYDGSSALMQAASIRLIDRNNYGSNPKYLKLLLAHGGDANAEEKGVRKKGNNTRYTPMLKACGTGNLEYAKLLINAGANINYNNEYGMNPLGSAVMFGGNPDLVMYLLEKGADYRIPVYPAFDGAKAIYITDWLKNWQYDPSSDNYKKQLQIIAFIRDHDMN